MDEDFKTNLITPDQTPDHTQIYDDGLLFEDDGPKYKKVEYISMMYINGKEKKILCDYHPEWNEEKLRNSIKNIMRSNKCGFEDREKEWAKYIEYRGGHQFAVFKRDFLYAIIVIEREFWHLGVFSVLEDMLENFQGEYDGKNDFKIDNEFRYQGDYNKKMIDFLR